MDTRRRRALIESFEPRIMYSAGPGPAGLAAAVLTAADVPYQRPLGVGFFFSLGHSTIVFGLALLLSIGVRAIVGPLEDAAMCVEDDTARAALVDSMGFSLRQGDRRFRVPLQALVPGLDGVVAKLFTVMREKPRASRRRALPTNRPRAQPTPPARPAPKALPDRCKPHYVSPARHRRQRSDG